MEQRKFKKRRMHWKKGCTEDKETKKEVKKEFNGEKNEKG